MKILVIGASGPTGQEIVKQAMEQGHAVTAFVRTAAKAKFAPPISSIKTVCSKRWWARRL